MANELTNFEIMGAPENRDALLRHIDSCARCSHDVSTWGPAVVSMGPGTLLCELGRRLVRALRHSAHVRSLAEFAPGDEVMTGAGAGVADGARAFVERVDLDHTHPGGHSADCYVPSRVEYWLVSVREDGYVGLRWREPAWRVHGLAAGSWCIRVSGPRVAVRGGFVQCVCCGRLLRPAGPVSVGGLGRVPRHRRQEAGA